VVGKAIYLDEGLSYDVAEVSARQLPFLTVDDAQLWSPVRPAATAEALSQLELKYRLAFDQPV
jgi:hypothetical protein